MRWVFLCLWARNVLPPPFLNKSLTVESSSFIFQIQISFYTFCKLRLPLWIMFIERHDQTSKQNPLLMAQKRENGLLNWEQVDIPSMAPKIQSNFLFWNYVSLEKILKNWLKWLLWIAWWHKTGWLPFTFTIWYSVRATGSWFENAPQCKRFVYRKVLPYDIQMMLLWQKSPRNECSKPFVNMWI